MKFSWILLCDAKYDDYTYCNKPEGHEGDHAGAWWRRKKDGTPDNRYRYNIDPDIEWGSIGNG
jgi:Txe/YoeB family toxin of Txe-Axe toxin-antitoxin module